MVGRARDGVETGNLVFYGTAGICLPFLEVLRQRFVPALVITQPDARGGRECRLIEPPVKRWACDHSVPCLQPESLRDPGLVAEISSLRPFIAVAIAYGKFIPSALFRIPEHGTVNVHFSLLPRYRGAAPVQRALQDGLTRTGLTVFSIDSRMDAGPVWAQLEADIADHDTCHTLQARLAGAGAPFLAEVLDGIRFGRLQPRPQDESLASLAPAVRKEEGRADWQLPARQLVDRWRAFTPWPGLFFEAGGFRFRITGLHADPATVDPAGDRPGRNLGIGRDGMRVACGGGTRLLVTEFQPAGKRPMAPFHYCLGNCLPEFLA